MQFIRPKLLNKESLILDIRTQEEYDEEHLLLPHIHEDMKNINDIDTLITKYHLTNEKTINILCSSGGGRAENIANKLQNHGIYNIAIILGGMDGIKNDNIETTIH